MQNTLRLVTLLAWGLCIPAYAQAPTFSIPPIPGSGAAATAPTPANTPTAPTMNAALPPPLPGMEAITNSANIEKKEEVAEAPKPPSEAEIPEEAKELLAKLEEADKKAKAEAATEEKPAEEAPYQVAAPSLTLDNAPATPKKEPEPKSNVTAAPPQLPSLALPVPPTAAGLSATAIPEVKVEAKRSIPTWKEVLKPSYKPMQTSFNFRRQVLPPTIYRDGYGYENRHLPLARSMPQYDHYFILAAARNDVNAVRAMLANGRRNVNLVNAEGESVLLVALRHGALQTAKLLIARGADTSARGANGWSAYDYAQYWGDGELLAALRG